MPALSDTNTPKHRAGADLEPADRRSGPAPRREEPAGRHVCGAAGGSLPETPFSLPAFSVAATAEARGAAWLQRERGEPVKLQPLSPDTTSVTEARRGGLPPSRQSGRVPAVARNARESQTAPSCLRGWIQPRRSAPEEPPALFARKGRPRGGGAVPFCSVPSRQAPRRRSAPPTPPQDPDGAGDNKDGATGRPRRAGHAAAGGGGGTTTGTTTTRTRHAEGRTDGPTDGPTDASGEGAAPPAAARGCAPPPHLRAEGRTAGAQAGSQLLRRRRLVPRSAAGSAPRPPPRSPPSAAARRT